jgi:hypothetical protein
MFPNLKAMFLPVYILFSRVFILESIPLFLNLIYDVCVYLLEVPFFANHSRVFSKIYLPISILEPNILHLFLQTNRDACAANMYIENLLNRNFVFIENLVNSNFIFYSKDVHVVRIYF